MSNALEQLAKHFDPAAIERKWYSRWESDGAFDATLKPGAPSFSIQLPPPNITGTLHMGHAFQQTIMDGLTRYHRMRGDNTLWLPGTDHAGIATQLVVERQLEAQGLRRKEMGRPAFVEKVWDWKRQSGGAITEQMRRIGSSVDWKREYFTMDDRMSSVVTSVFVRLYRQGLIYRGTRLVNWDPVLRTAVSDIEVVAEETDGHLWYIQYPLSSGAGTLTVATTRPETLLGDVAVMVHPEDERYAPLLGQTVKLPLCDREIPIIADTAVDKEFGSGVVKVTPAHDFNDYAVGVRHGLPSITILTLDGKISDEAPAAYRGMDRFEARDKIVADLKAQGYLESVKPHKLMVPRGEKSRVVLEPMLTGQWFVAMSTPDETGKSITQKALEVVENGEVQFVPPDWANTYYSWLRNVQDWCISRQLWWGHQIPAWYDEDGNIFVAENEQDAQAQAGGRTLRRDEDVLDTWFSSGLIPFSSLGWPEQTPELDAFLPSSVLVTGYDIIFFWVARMIALTTHFTGKVPFKHVYIHGLIRDAEGGKMSKSEGNVLDPVDLIDGIALEELQQKRTIGLRRPETAPKVIAKTKDEFPDGVPAYGADALRFTFASLASLGRSINFDQKRCEGYRFFCNKLWNATRFVLMQTEGHQVDSAIDLSKDLSFADRWIRSQLQETEKAVTAALDSFRFDLASQAIYEFAWNQYCDWYIELAKVQLQSAEASDAQKNATRATLLGVLETILRLAHPIMPFITEELWQVVAPLAGRKSTESLMSAVWPTPDASQIDKEADGEVETLKALIVAARSLRSEMGLSPAQKVPLLLEGSPDFERFAPYLVMLARLSSVNVVAQLPDDDAPVAVATQARLMLKIEVDKASERARIAKEIAKATDALDKLVAKLERPGYVDKAPQHLVEKDRAQVDELKGKLGKLEAQATKLA